MDLRDHLRILRMHWVGVFVITLLVVAAAAAYDLSRTKIYAADANAFVSTGQAGDGIDATVNDDLAKSRATSYVVIAKSRATAEQVIEDLGIEASPSVLASQITVEQPTDTVLLHITATDTSPERARVLADAWVAALGEQVQALEAPSGKASPGTPRIVAYSGAELPSTPISPQPTRDLLIALLVGLALGYGYALLRHKLDLRVRNAKQVEARFQVPVLGSVPMAGALSEAPGSRSQVIIESSDSSQRQREAAEAFRKLRTNLVFMQVDSPPRVIVITSPQPGDGKSTVAANLAGAIAFSGQKVVLVDGDLRRPTVATSLQLDEGVGLTDVLVGAISLTDAIQQSRKHENLFVLPAGRVPPNPSELLGSQSMRQLLKQLEGDYLVVIDAPPLLPVTDAAILTAAADGAIVVISAGRTVEAELGQALATLRAVNGRALGVILNKSSRRSTGGAYHYQNYGYYGHDEGPRGFRRVFGSRAKPGSAAPESHA